VRRKIRGKWDFMLGNAAPDSEDGIGCNEEEEDDEMVAPAAMKLEALVPDEYNEDAATAAALATSKANEKAKWSWPGLEDVVQLLAMVTDHVAFLPPPPPFPPHAPPRAAWDGQEVPPPPQHVPPATPPQYVSPPEVPAWGQQLWAPPSFVKLISDNEEDYRA
jgi:hypothetical protein